VPGFFHLVHVGNTGAAWSLFTGKSLWLAALAVITLAAIFIFRHHLELGRPMVQVSFGLLCGGIVGNLVDRIAHGHVIDFLLFEFGSYEFPVFNIADTAICVGVGLYLIHSFRSPQADDAAPQAPTPPAE
jgi:signal peptidase II